MAGFVTKWSETLQKGRKGFFPERVLSPSTGKQFGRGQKNTVYASLVYR